MGKKRNVKDDFPIFYYWIRKTIDDYGGQAKFSRDFNISTTTLSYWYNGTRMADAYNLFKLSKLFDVSVDYLLGLSSIRSPNADLKAVCEFTGLSQEAVEKLQAEDTITVDGKTERYLIKDNMVIRKILDFFLSNNSLMFEDLMKYIWFATFHNANCNKLDILLNNQTLTEEEANYLSVLLRDAFKSSELFEFRASKVIQGIVDRYITSDLGNVDFFLDEFRESQKEGKKALNYFEAFEMGEGIPSYYY